MSKTNKTKKTLILVENLPVPHDQRVWREAIALDNAGYQVSIISRKGRSYDNLSYEKIKNISIYRFRAHEARSHLFSFFIEYTQALLMMFYLSIKVFLKEGFDVIQMCNPPDFLFLIALPYKLFGKKIIFDHHDPFPEMFLTKKNKTKSHVFYKILIFLEKMTFKISDIVISTNNSHKNIAINRGGILEKNIFVVRNGPNFEQIKAIEKKQILKKYNNLTLGYIGVIGETDGVDNLLKSIKILQTEFQRDDIKIIIIGNGTELKKMKKYSKELGLDTIVEFTGRLPYQDAMNRLIYTDICICPDPKTSYSNLCTLCKTMDYMALAKPIVSFDLLENKYTANNSAIYAQNNNEFDFARKINLLLDNESLRKKLGLLGIKRLEDNKLYWNDSVINLLEAYKRCFIK